MTLLIAPRSQVSATCLRHAPSHVVSLLSPGGDPPVEIGAGARCLDLSVNDITTPVAGLVAPDEALVGRLLEFGRDWSGDTPFLVYCWAGVSRSTAAAYALACQHRPDLNEERIARALRQAAQWATPNALIVAIADFHLGRQGRMVAAIRAIGRGADTLEGRAVSLDFR